MPTPVEVPKAVLRVKFPQTSDEAKRMAAWLREKAKEIAKAQPDQYAKNFTARLF